MAIDPHLFATGGSEQRIVARLADLSRQVDGIQAISGAIPPGGVTGGQIAVGTITATEIAAGAIVAGTIAAGAVTAGTIAANAITAGTIAAGAISTSNVFATGVVNTNAIAAGAVLAGNISVSNLAAVSSVMGTVTGGIFQTATSGARVMLGTGLVTSLGTTNGLIGVDGSGNVTFNIDATTGNVTLKGTLQQGSTGLGNIQGVTQNAISMASGQNLQITTDSVSGWTATSATTARDTATYLTAPASLKYVTTAAGTQNFWGNLPAAVVGQPYSAATYLYHTNATNLVFTMTVQALNSGFAVISATPGSAVTVPPNQWTRIYAENSVMPAGAVYVQAFVTVAAAPNGLAVWMDNWFTVQNASAMLSMVVANSITATEISVGSLSAVSANMGTLTSGTINGGTINGVAINGGTITGAVVQTSSSGARSALDSTGFYVTDSGGTKIVGVDQTFGVTIFAGTSGVPVPGIEFTDTGVAGTPRASIYAAGGSTAGTGTLIMYAGQGPGHFPQASISAFAQGAPSLVQANAFNSGGGGLSVTIIDASGVSDFARVKNVTSQRGKFIQSATLAITVAAGTWTSYTFPYTASATASAEMAIGLYVPGGITSAVYYGITSVGASSCTVTLYSSIAFSGYFYNIAMTD